jgi:hypothetical protein
LFSRLSPSSIAFFNQFPNLIVSFLAKAKTNKTYKSTLVFAAERDKTEKNERKRESEKEKHSESEVIC